LKILDDKRNMKKAEMLEEGGASDENN